MALIKLKNIKKEYNVDSQRIIALNGINLELPKCGMIFITGKSGSGKSTLLNILGGIDVRDSGEIVFDNISMSDFKPSDYDDHRNAKVGFVFQEYNLFEEKSVKDNIKLALSLQHKRATDKSIKESLAEVGLEGFSHRKVKTLSGGQKQRVAIARALIKSPALLLADEPTGALDSETGHNLFNTLKKLSKTRLIIIVSHDDDYAGLFADRIIKLKDGEVVEDVTLNDKINGDILENTKEVKTGLPLVESAKLALGAFFSKPIRLAAVVILSAIAFCMFTVISAIADYSAPDTVYNSIQNLAYVNYAAFSKEIPSREYENSWITSNLTDGDIEKIRRDTGCDAFTGVIELRIRYSSLPTAALPSPYYFTDARGIAMMSQELLNKYGFSITGQLPDNDGEIALSKYAYEMFFAAGYYRGATQTTDAINSPEDLIGKQLYFDFSDEFLPKYYTVSGIIDTGFNYGRYSSLKSVISSSNMTYAEQVLFNELNGLMSTSFHTLIFVNQDFVDLILPSHNFFNMSGSNTNMVAYRQNVPLSAGNPGINNTYYKYFCELKDIDTDKVVWKDGKVKTELGAQEVVISFNALQDYPYGDTDLYITIWTSMNEDPAYSLATHYEILKRELTVYAPYIFNSTSMDSLVIEYYNNSKGISVTGENAKIYEIVGIVYDNKAELSGNLIVIADDFKEELTDILVGPYSFAIAAFTDDADSMRAIVDYSFREEAGLRFRLNNPISEKIYFSNDILMTMKQVGLYVALGLALFAFIILFNYISVSILCKKKEIGILRALGARGRDVFGVFFIESILISLAVFVLALILSYAATLVTNSSLNNQFSLGITLFFLGAKQVFMLLGICLAGAFAATALPIARASRKRPVEVIRNL